MRQLLDAHEKIRAKCGPLRFAASKSDDVDIEAAIAELQDLLLSLNPSLAFKHDIRSRVANRKRNQDRK